MKISRVSSWYFPVRFSIVIASFSLKEKVLTSWFFLCHTGFNFPLTCIILGLWIVIYFQKVSSSHFSKYHRVHEMSLGDDMLCIASFLLKVPCLPFFCSSWHCRHLTELTVKNTSPNTKNTMSSFHVKKFYYNGNMSADFQNKIQPSSI